MLFVQVLLIIRVVIVLLGHLSNKLVQSVARCIVLHQQWITLCCFDSNFSLFRVVLLDLVFVLIGGWFFVLERVDVGPCRWDFLNLIYKVEICIYFLSTIFLRIVVLNTQILVIGLLAALSTVLRQYLERVIVAFDFLI